MSWLTRGDAKAPIAAVTATLSLGGRSNATMQLRSIAGTRIGELGQWSCLTAGFRDPNRDKSLSFMTGDATLYQYIDGMNGSADTGHAVDVRVITDVTGNLVYGY